MEAAGYEDNLTHPNASQTPVDLPRFGGHLRVRDGHVPEGSPHGSESTTVSGGVPG